MSHQLMRVGFDMDGVLADFAAEYRAVEMRLFGPDECSPPGDPEVEQESLEREEPSVGASPTPAVSEATRQPRKLRRRHDAVWQAIAATPDFWTSLKPTDPSAVRRIHSLMLQHRWEVFFITQRPSTLGDTVQRQTQRWLVEQGFDLPSVLVIHGSRGAAAGALRLDYHVDDSPQNCIDVKSESNARPILISDPADPAMAASARRLGINIAGTIGEALDVLQQASLAPPKPPLLQRVAQLVGWS